MEKGNDKFAQAVAWAVYSVPFIAAYGTEIVAFLREWKELAGAALGVIGAFWVASLTNRQNTRNAMRQSEAILTQGDLESLLLDVQSLRKYSIAATDYHVRLSKLVNRYINASKETKFGLLEKIKRDFCDVPPPKELDPFSVVNDTRALTPDIQKTIIVFHEERNRLAQLIPHAVNPNNMAEEVRDSCILIAGSILSCCKSINEQITAHINYIGNIVARERVRYAKLRNWERD